VNCIILAEIIIGSANRIIIMEVNMFVKSLNIRRYYYVCILIVGAYDYG
jgi:hypothetical protein